MKAICSIGKEEIDSGFDDYFRYFYCKKPCCRKHYFESLGDVVEYDPGEIKHSFKPINGDNHEK